MTRAPHEQGNVCRIWWWQNCKLFPNLITRSRVTHSNESFSTRTRDVTSIWCLWIPIKSRSVMAHIQMSHAPHTKTSCHQDLMLVELVYNLIRRHGTHSNESCPNREFVMSLGFDVSRIRLQLNYTQTCHTFKWVLLHSRTHHATRKHMFVKSVSNLKWAMFSIWKRHVTRIWWQWNWFPISSLPVWRVLKSKGALRAPNMLLSPPKSTVRWQLRIFSYIYIYIYIFIYISIYIHMYMYTYTCFYVYVYMYISIYLYILYVYTYSVPPNFTVRWILCIFLYIYVFLYICKYVYMCIYIYRCICLYVNMYIFICIYVYMHICIYYVCIYTFCDA